MVNREVLKALRMLMVLGVLVLKVLRAMGAAKYPD
jgi:hypothetical protein